MTGTITDSNGTPLAGVTVTVPAGAIAAGSSSGGTTANTATTTSSGQFSIPNVTVEATSVNGTAAGSQSGNGSIDLVITPPAGYLAATVAVTPQAQTLLPPAGGATTGGTNTVFVNGFIASTGVLELPTLTASVKGTLQNSDGSPIAKGTVLTAQFGGFVPESKQSTGVVITYAFGEAMAPISDTSGDFSFSNLPDQSCFYLGSAGLVITASGAAGPCPVASSGGGTTVAAAPTDTSVVYTGSQGGSQVALGNVLSSPAGVSLVAPFITSVQPVANQLDTSGAAGATGGTDTGGVVGILNANSTTITVNFSQGVTIPTSGIVVTETPISPAGNPTVVTPTITSTAQSLTLTFAAPLPAGNTVTVAIPTGSVTDASGLALSATIPSTLLPNLNVIEPTFIGSNGSNYVDVYLQTPLASNTTVAATTGLTQLVAPQNPANDPFYLTSAAFINTVNNESTSADYLPTALSPIAPPFYTELQLNAQESPGLANPATVLSYFADCLNAGLAGPAGTVTCATTPPTTVAAFSTVLSNVTSISFTPSGASDYVIAVYNPTAVTTSSGNSLAVGFVSTDAASFTATKRTVSVAVASTSTATIFDTADGTGAKTTSVIPPFGATGGTTDVVVSPVTPLATTGTITLELAGVLPGEIVYVVPRGVNNTTGTASAIYPTTLASVQSLTLVDDAPPTVVAQDAAVALFDAAVTAGSVSTTGTGGGVVLPSSAGAGAAVYPVTPLLLNINSGTTGNAGALTGAGSLNALSAGAAAFTTYGLTDIGGTTYTLPLAIPDGTTTSVTVGGNTDTFYDATGAAAFAPAPTIGINVSEKLSTATLPTPTSIPATGTATATFTSPGFIPDASYVFPIGSGTSHVSNLYTAKVSNVFALAADARTGPKSLLSVAGIKDAAGNTGSNAQAVLRDFVPPLMTSGQFNGTAFTFVFNKPLSLQVKNAAGTALGDSTLYLETCKVSVDLFKAAATTGTSPATNPATGVVNANGTYTYTLPVTNSVLVAALGATGLGSCFDVTNAPMTYVETAYGTTAYPHGFVNFDNVFDADANADIFTGYGTTGSTSTTASGANSWGNWTGLSAGLAAGTLGETTPHFAMALTITPFVTVAPAATATLLRVPTSPATDQTGVAPTSPATAITAGTTGYGFAQGSTSAAAVQVAQSSTAGVVYDSVTFMFGGQTIDFGAIYNASLPSPMTNPTNTRTDFDGDLADSPLGGITGVTAGVTLLQLNQYCQKKFGVYSLAGTTYTYLPTTPALSAATATVSAGPNAPGNISCYPVNATGGVIQPSGGTATLDDQYYIATDLAQAVGLQVNVGQFSPFSAVNLTGTYLALNPTTPASFTATATTTHKTISAAIPNSIRSLTVTAGTPDIVSSVGVIAYDFTTPTVQTNELPTVKLQ